MARKPTFSQRIDLPTLSLVVHVEVPRDAETLRAVTDAVKEFAAKVAKPETMVQYGGAVMERSEPKAKFLLASGNADSGAPENPTFPTPAASEPRASGSLRAQLSPALYAARAGTGIGIPFSVPSTTIRSLTIP